MLPEDLRPEEVQDCPWCEPGSRHRCPDCQGAGVLVCANEITGAAPCECGRCAYCKRVFCKDELTRLDGEYICDECRAHAENQYEEPPSGAIKAGDEAFTEARTPNHACGIAYWVKPYKGDGSNAAHDGRRTEED